MKIVKINSCAYCPFTMCDLDKKQEFCCHPEFVDTYMRLDENYEIPSWCPLEAEE